MNENWVADEIMAIKKGGRVGPHASTHASDGTDPVTPASIGLGNVNNTSDLNKPVSTATQTALNNKQNKHITATATLTTAGWDSTEKTQTVSVSGVTASNTVIAAPVSDNYEEYGDALVRVSAQGTSQLTFICKDIPTVNLTVNVVIFN